MNDINNNNYCINPVYNQHIMLLYKDKNKRNNIIIDYINEGLNNGCFCIYASVDLDNSKGISLIDNLSSRIINYEENIKNENLKFINFKPYYESALKGDLTLFEKLKSELEYTLYKRVSEGKKDKILVFADAACHLSENREFEECINLEKWWQDVNLDWVENKKDITVVCPHPSVVFNEDSRQDIKNKIGDSHDATFDIEDKYFLQYFSNLITRNKQIRILIAESNPDMHYFYREYLNEYLQGLGLDILVVENGSKCIEYLLDSKEKGKGGFDIVILDSHLPDINGIDVIKQIRKNMPNQRIIFTTTYSLNQIKNVIDSFGIDKNDVLLKPFYFTKLLSIINPLITIK